MGDILRRAVGLLTVSGQPTVTWLDASFAELDPITDVSVLHETIETERAGSVADGNSNTPRGAVVESGVQPDAGEVDAEFESRPGPLSNSRPEPDVSEEADRG